MSADLMLAVAFLGCLAAAAVLAYGIARLDIRLVAAGGAAAGMIWLGWGWSSEAEWTTYRLADLRLHVVDSATGKALQGVTVNTVASSERTERAVYRLPATLAARGIFSVSIIAELHLTGSLLGQLRQPATHTKVADQELEFKAPGYRPLHRNLTQLLPDGWPAAPLPATPVQVRLDPD
ncbi:MAG TPA: hypothetical protein VNH11_18495 [Pirellulales bacterium]|nr:hypothetical protein [Pirellulales bacterium]